MFLTYKGAMPVHGARKRVPLSRVCMQTSSGSSTVRILADMPVNRRGTLNSSQFDPRETFDTSHPTCGVIDLSIYGFVPLHDQDLEQLKTFVSCFVRGTDTKVESKAQEESQVFNVFIHRTVADVKYLYHSAGPMEKGQISQLTLPTVASLLNPARYLKSESSADRLVLDEALSVLSQDDLRRILKFLSDNVKPNDVKEQRRARWICSRVLQLLKEATAEDKTVLSSTSTVTVELRGLPREDVSAVVKEELLSLLENNACCGSIMRAKWCKLEHKLFDALLNKFTSYGSAPKDEAANFKEAVVSTFQPFFDLGEQTDLVELDTGASLEAVDDSQHEARNLSGGIACIDYSQGSDDSIVFKTLEDVTVDRSDLAYDWYRVSLWDITLTMLTCFDMLLDNEQRADLALATVRQSIDESVLNAYSQYPNEPQRAAWNKSRVCLPTGLVEDGTFTPGTYQFFLGIVWPALREEGWRLEAGATTASVVYLPPKAGFKKRTKDDHGGSSKKRMRLSRNVDKIGWGSVKKLAQRMVVYMDPAKPRIDKGTTSSMSVSQATDLLEKRIVAQLKKEENDNANTIISKAREERAKQVTRAVRDCFDAFAPFLATEAKWLEVTKGSKNTPCETYGAECLLHWLLVLPTVLRQSDLPLQEISDSLQVVQDVVEFYMADYKQLLDKRLQPADEVYEQGEQQGTAVNSILAERLKLLEVVDDSKKKDDGNTTNGDGSDKKEDSTSIDNDELTMALLPEDKVTPDGAKKLTDFVVTVMEQAIPCRACEDDADKKFRRIHVGYPGLSCKHCEGSSGEGRYFFSTLESLTTASTVLEKHLLKCEAVPDDLKDKIREYKLTHPAQRKTLSSGTTQQEYFNRLWDRLRTCRIGGVQTSAVLSTSSLFHRRRQQHDTDANDEEQHLAEGLEFKNHVLLLDHVRTCWRSTKSILTALAKYYSCLDYGGRIYQTPSMPERFSSEWLLAKVVPNIYEYPKFKYLPGGKGAIQP